MRKIFGTFPPFHFINHEAEAIMKWWGILLFYQSNRHLAVLLGIRVIRDSFSFRGNSKTQSRVNQIAEIH